MEIGLTGNPNSGKTTIFNALTGANQYVGNWPGVTVEKKSGVLKDKKEIQITDLPGVYSLSPYTLEEIVTRDFLANKKANIIIDVLDSSNLERNLYLVLQLMEMELPVVLAFNMLDLVEKSGRKLNLQKFSYMLQVPVVGVSALRKRGLKELVKTTLRQKDIRYTCPKYDDRLESAISMIEKVLPESLNCKRWYAIKLFEKDSKVLAKLSLKQESLVEINEIIKTAQRVFEDESDSIIATARYDYIVRLVSNCAIETDDFKMSLSDKIDNLVTNKYLAFPIFAFVMWLVYYISIQEIGRIGSDWINDVFFGSIVPNNTEKFLNMLGVLGWMKSLIIDGIIAGVGSVLGFLPQIALLFLCLGILEDCGYMARIAFVMDRVFRKFNLSGKSFIPLLISTGCGVPGIMATRTIESKENRKMTIMLTTFMPCSAKLTVIAMIAGTFFPKQSFIAPSAYFIGIFAVIFSGIFLKKTHLFHGKEAPFVMELPSYHLPIIGNLLNYVLVKVKSFIKKAGTIIFASCVIIWILSNLNIHFHPVDAVGDSLLHDLGSLIAPIFAPIGFGNWQATVAVIAGLIAKENCIDTLKIAFGSPNGVLFKDVLRENYTALGAYCFLIFNLLCAPCFAAIGTMYKEFGDLKWTIRALCYQTGIAYLMALIVYQWGKYIKDGSLDNFVLAMFATLVIIYGIFIKKASKREMS